MFATIKDNKSGSSKQLQFMKRIFKHYAEWNFRKGKDYKIYKMKLYCQKHNSVVKKT